MAPVRTFRRLSIADGPELPTEFRLFVAGWNETENGSFLFDADAAEATMAAYAKWGVDLMIDLEHQSLEPTIAPDPTAKDARGWCNLELREDGSLWAVNVKWTADGEARLREKRQRYISPAFSVDAQSKRVTAIINVAITAIPATHDTPALVAASRLAALSASGAASMDPKLVQEALDALIADDAAKCQEILKSLVAAAAGAEAAEEAAEEAPAEAPAMESAASEPEAPAMESAAPAAAEDDEEDKETVAAAISRLTRSTGKSTIAAAVEEVEVWRKSHLDLEAQRAQIAKEREALELAARRENAAKLVQLGAETPATSGLASFAKGAKGKLAKRLLDEPLDEQNARVAALLAARGGKLPADAAPKPPTGATTGEAAAAPAPSKFFLINGKQIEVTARELAICEESKCEPKTFAALKARRDSTPTA